MPFLPKGGLAVHCPAVFARLLEIIPGNTFFVAGVPVATGKHQKRAVQVSRVTFAIQVSGTAISPHMGSKKPYNPKTK